MSESFQSEHLTPAPTAPVPTTASSTLAVVSMCLGIAGLVLIGLLGSIGAVITGHMAKKRILTQPDAFTGEGMAKAGLITGYVGIVLNVIVMIVIIAIFFFSYKQLEPIPMDASF